MRTGCEPTRFGNEAKTIIHGDALAELKKLPTESVDLIFADPPYNIGKNFDGLIEAWKEDLFIDWLFEVIAECHRVLKKQGSMYIMNSTENMPFIDLQCRKLFTIKSRIVWSYDSSGVQAKKHYGSMYEPILMMVKDAKNYTFNGDAILVEAKTGSQRALINYRKNPPQPYNHQKVPAHPFHLDMATSVVPAGKMEVYAKAGKTLPGDWLMNSDGSPSYDPNDFLRIRATTPSAWRCSLSSGSTPFRC